MEDGGHGRDHVHGRRVGVRLQELLDYGVRVEMDGPRIGADKGPPIQARGPVRQVVFLQPVEQRLLDLGLLRDRDEGDPPFFTLLAQSRAQSLRHGHLFHHHANTDTGCWRVE